MKNIKDVELFVFDLDGTVYIGDEEIEGSFAAINELRSMGKRICFFTNNSSRMHTDYIARLNNLGLRTYADEIYTSGQVTCEYLLDNYRGKKVFLLGNDRLKSEFELYGIELDEENPDLCVIGFDTSLTYDKLYRFCKFLHKGLPYISTHPDFFCPAPECPMPTSRAHRGDKTHGGAHSRYHYGQTAHDRRRKTCDEVQSSRKENRNGRRQTLHRRCVWQKLRIRVHSRAVGRNDCGYAPDVKDKTRLRP